MSRLDSFTSDLKAVVVGASGGIGGAFVEALRADERVARVLALSRSGGPPGGGKLESGTLDALDEGSVAAAAEKAREKLGEVDLVLCAIGVLQDESRGLRPERTWRALDADQLTEVFRTNTVGPALVAKHFLPLLGKDRKTAFAALSARVGSIGDNRFGGWHAYRASKAALNMLVRCFAIELARRNGSALCVGLHPGTVDTGLSAPFQANVPDDKLFAPDFAATSLLDVLNRLGPADSGGCYAWDGERIPP